jgi:hypothetical protein
MWCDDHVVQAEERVRRLPVPLLGRFFLDVVQAGSCDPALFEGQVQGVIFDDGPAGRVDQDQPSP